MKKLVIGLSALSLFSWHSAAFSQCCVSHPSIRWEQWHYSDSGYLYLTGHFYELCNGQQYNWGHPDIHSVHASGDCGD